MSQHSARLTLSTDELEALKTILSQTQTLELTASQRNEAGTLWLKTYAALDRIRS